MSPHPLRPAGPSSTYRIQLRQGVTFATVEALAPYLADLGISSCYLSPIFLARAGSTHGYDVCDPTMLDPELGGAVAFEQMRRTLQRHDLDLVLDIVPNFYQGTEDWSCHLVDPDNRDVPDFARLQTRLADLRARKLDGPASVTELLDTWGDGRIKLYITARALQARRQHHGPAFGIARSRCS